MTVSESKGPLFVALDAGTGSGRCGIFDERGRLVSSARRPWTPVVPPGLESFGREFDPSLIWKTLCETAKEAVQAVDASRIAAVGATAQRIGCAFLDSTGETLYLGPNRDIRALSSDLAFESLVSEGAIYEITRHWPPWIFAPARLCWFKAHAPNVHEKIQSVVSFNDWMIFKLCGRVCAEPTAAADLMMLDVTTRSWSQEIAAALGLNPDQMPELTNPGEIAGPLQPAAAKAIGLPEAIPVVAGAGDTQSALLGSGVLEPGDVGVVAGSSAPLMLVTDRPRIDPEGNLWSGCHVLPDRWLLEANVGEMGTMHLWMLNTFCEDLKARAANTGTDPYSLYDQVAAQAPPGGAGVTSHIGPRPFRLRNVNTARPAAILMPFGETQVGPSRSAMLRAFYENAAFAIRANLERIEQITGEPAGGFTISGGMSRSSLFCGILASVLGREVEAAASSEASALGAAICAARGLGRFDSFKEAIDRMVASPVRYAPDDEDAEEYEDGYETWLEREEQLEDF